MNLFETEKSQFYPRRFVQEIPSFWRQAVSDVTDLSSISKGDVQNSLWLSTKQANEQKKKEEIKERKRKSEREGEEVRQSI